MVTTIPMLFLQHFYSEEHKKQQFDVFFPQGTSKSSMLAEEEKVRAPVLKVQQDLGRKTVAC